MTKVIPFNTNRTTVKEPIISLSVKELQAIYNALFNQYEKDPKSFSEQAECAIGILNIRLETYLNPTASNLYKSFEQSLLKILLNN